ncbi:hypothetical protein CEE34_02255 [Candidatus Aerophobetes bacterium Ae_b3a]|nr:MAG: hypothetical protein CEE34_02255 [Candidatus Aerophobetes bacterium Ae_b3a]
MKKKGKMSKSISISLTIVFMLGIVGLVGQAIAAEQVTINLWTQYNDPQDRKAIEYIINVFEKENPEVKIGHRIMPNYESDQMIRTVFAGGNPPDISLSQDPYTMSKTFEAGKIMDLTKWYAQYGDRFPESAKGVSRKEGKYFGVPDTMLTAAHMFYNKKLAKSLGVTEPQNYTEFLEVCEKAKNQGVIPLAFGNKEGWTGGTLYQMYLFETVGLKGINDMIDRKDPEQGPYFTDPGFIRAAKYFNDLHEKGYLSEGVAITSFDASKMEYLGGKALFFFTGSWYSSFDFPPDFEWGFFRFPHIIGELGYNRDEGLVAYLGKMQIATTTSHPELCLKFLEVFSRPDVMHDSFFEMGKYLPAVAGAVKPEELTEFQEAMVAFARTNTGSCGFMEPELPPAVGMGQVWTGLTAISADEITPLEFCESVEKVYKKELVR